MLRNSLAVLVLAHSKKTNVEWHLAAHTIVTAYKYTIPDYPALVAPSGRNSHAVYCAVTIQLPPFLLEQHVIMFLSEDDVQWKLRKIP